MRFTEDDNESASRILFHQTADAPRYTEIAPSDAAHVISRMTIHSVHGNLQLARRCEDSLITLPIAAPLLVVMHGIEKFLFGNLAVHPTVEDLLVSCENRFDGNKKVVLFFSQFADKFRCVNLALAKGMVVPDPNQVRLPCFFQDVLWIAGVMECLKFPAKFLDIFPAWRRVDLADIVLDKPNRLFF